MAETSHQAESSLRFPKQARACESSLKELPQLADTVLSVKPGISYLFKGGVTDSTLCRSLGLHVGDDGGSVSIHLK